MSNVPIPEPDFVQVHKPAFYKDIPIRLDWWSATSMHAHAAKTSAAKDKEIERLRADCAQLRADAIERQNNVVAPLRARVRVLEDARPEPDCRTCASSCSMDGRAVCILPRKHCTNGDRYEPLPPVRIWRKV